MTFELCDVSFSYRTKDGFNRDAVNGVNLCIRQGECVGVIGHEGAGKTTLLQIITGLLKPDKGKVVVDGIDTWRMPQSWFELRKQIGLAFQFPEQQFFCDTVEDELTYGLKNFGYAEGFMKPEDALVVLGLLPEQYLHRSPFSLSMGEARRVALATLLIPKPQALLLDEPTVGLDGAGVAIVLNLLREMKAAGNTTIIVSHDIDVLAEVASCVVIMSDGRITDDGPVGLLLTDSGLLLRHGYQLPEVVRFMRQAGRGREAAHNIHTFREAKRWLELEREGK